MEYKVIHARNYDELMVKVNEHLSQGWEPQGGVAVEVGGGGYCNGFLQALIRGE
jgi:Domain of unknown function (DUF1737)